MENNKNTGEEYVSVFVTDYEGYYTGAAISVKRKDLTEDSITVKPRYPRTSPILNKWNPTTKQWDDVLTDEGRTQLWAEIKRQRNLLIAETDWTQCADVSLSDEKKQQIVEYRQALRDLSKTYSDPRNVVWPTNPL